MEENKTHKHKKNNTQIKIVDLYAGTGGFSTALETIHPIFKCVFANDFVKQSKQIFDLNHNTELTLKDMMRLEPHQIPKHNILCAGMSCQPFSIAGQKKGFSDPRANTFWKLIDICKYHNPSIVVIENVKNLLTHDNSKTFEIIKTTIEKIGYYVKYQVLDTMKITSIPQHRERLFIVCFKNKIHYDNFNFPIQSSNWISNNISDYLQPSEEINEKYYYKPTSKIYPILNDYIVKDISTNTVYQYRRTYLRENKNKCVPTLTHNAGTGGHNVPIIKDSKGFRKLTPRECFNLQGFPSWFDFGDLSDSQLYGLAGNAITIPVVKKLFIEIMKCIKIDH
jgi:DNA (cytosine-5)-methyltransferase 1